MEIINSLARNIFNNMYIIIIFYIVFKFKIVLTKMQQITYLCPLARIVCTRGLQYIGQILMLLGAID